MGGGHHRRVPRQPARQRDHGGAGLGGQGLSRDGDGGGGRRGALASVTARLRSPASSRTPQGSDTRTVRRSPPRSPWWARRCAGPRTCCDRARRGRRASSPSRPSPPRSEEHTSELQSRLHLVCRLLLEKKKMVVISRIPILRRYLHIQLDLSALEPILNVVDILDVSLH